MNFNRFGNLDGGIVPISDLKEIHSFFVHGFPESITRERNYSGMLSFFELLKSIGLGQYITKYWIDGSFTSNKIDPNDIDLIVMLDANPSVVDGLHDYIQTNWESIRIEAEKLHCDVYALFDIDTVDKTDIKAYQAFDYQRKYWMGQFGFDRNMNPKGIIELVNEQEGDENDANSTN